MKFVIEQVAFRPSNSVAARALASVLGWNNWSEDVVVADGLVYGVPGINKAHLAFNYESSSEHPLPKPLEVEFLNYAVGPNWLADYPGSVASHIAMHCTEEELAEWTAKLCDFGAHVVQVVDTISHTNPAIANSRRYKYTIFGTRAWIGVDLKFIVRKDLP